MNGVGKPCAGERHARFDRGPLGKVTCTSEIERNPQVTTLCGATVSRRCDYSLNQRPTSQEPLWPRLLVLRPAFAVATRPDREPERALVLLVPTRHPPREHRARARQRDGPSRQQPAPLESPLPDPRHPLCGRYRVLIVRTGRPHEATWIRRIFLGGWLYSLPVYILEHGNRL